MKSKTSTKTSDINIEFWRKGNLNLTIRDGTMQYNLTPSDFQEYIVKYFKLNTHNYIELADLIIKMENNKNGIK